MAVATSLVTQQVLKHLERSEMRVLALTVAVRKGLGPDAPLKGDLGQAIRLALRKLVADQSVKEADGVFMLVRDPGEPRKSRPLANSGA